MTLLELINDVRMMTRDFSNSIFREPDIVRFLNQGINRVKQVVSELSGMKELADRDDEVILLPVEYNDLLPVYATSRCFMQDESFYQATTYMNEFEVKLAEMLAKIEAGEVVIVDEDGNPVVSENEMDAVVDVYFSKKGG